MENPNLKWMRTGGSPILGDDTLKCTGKPPEFHGEIDGFRFRFFQQNQSIADWFLLPTN